MMRHHITVGAMAEQTAHLMNQEVEENDRKGIPKNSEGTPPVT
jgi:hypothetical protein